MSNWIDTSNNNLVFTDTGTTIDAGSSITLTYNGLLDWFPPASQRKKYFPAWHLVRSYKCNKL